MIHRVLRPPVGGRVLLLARKAGSEPRPHIRCPIFLSFQPRLQSSLCMWNIKMGNDQSGGPVVDPSPNDFRPNDTKWNTCETLQNHHFGRFKRETWNGRPCIHLHWAGPFPDGGEQATASYGAVYWVDGRGFIRKPIHVWNEWFATWGMFPIDAGEDRQYTAHEVLVRLPCAGYWKFPESAPRSDGQDGRRTVRIWWEGAIPSDDWQACTEKNGV